MRAVYKKRIAESRITGKKIVQEIPLEIHYEGVSILPGAAIIKCEPFDGVTVVNSDDIAYLYGVPVSLRSLKLVIEEVSK